MGLLGKILVASLVVMAALFWAKLNETAPPPVLHSEWWAQGQPQAVDTSIRPFKINVPDQVLKDLDDRLKVYPTLTPPLEGIGFEYGFNSKYLGEVVQFWRTQYNWREREKFLNKFPQFKTRVSGLDLHFLHVKPTSVPQGVEVVPLLLLHGWPGSVREFYSIIPLLTTPRQGSNFVFEVVAPSVPGFGFSEGAHKPGFGPAQIAVVMKDLMERIGFKNYYVQGGDWGAFIGTHMATLFPERVLGFHSNMCSSTSMKSVFKNLIGSFWPTLFVEQRYADKVFPYWEKFFGRILEEMGYFHLQATKPDTVGVGLQTSPVGLAAYLLEKFSGCTDLSWKSLPDGGLTKKFSLTDLLDNVMIYWVTNSITTSIRIYTEYFTRAQMALNLDIVPNYTPTACVQFINEVLFTPESMARDKHRNLVRYTVQPRGGHFAAFEEPKLLADDVWESIEIMRQQAKK